MKKIISNLLFAVSGGLIAAGAVYFISPENIERVEVIHNSSPIQSISAVAPATSGVDFTVAANETLDKVVHIKTLSTQQVQQSYDPFQDFFFGQPHHRQAPQQRAGSGSGVIISNDGYIATNNHVINGATDIEVTLNDKRSFKAKVIGTDPTTDLALIKIEASDLKQIYYGNSDDVNIGQWALAVGNPFNLTSTVTAGIVSAKGRNINILDSKYAIESFIQTDAAVNPGNSGGALVNTAGQLIGINTAIASNTGSYTGYSFAIPVNMVQKVMSDLLKYGQVQRALLGVQIRDIDSHLAEEKDIKDLKGVYISNIFENSAASDAKLEAGDIITKIGNVAVSKSSELQEQISQFRPGDEIAVTFVRDGNESTATVILKNAQGTTALIKKDEIVSFLGAEFSALTDAEKSKLKIKNGVKISSLDTGKFRSEGIKEGYIITRIDNEDVESPEEVMNILKNKKGGVLLEGVYPNGARAFYGFGM